jgi:hypothetical protein
MTDPSIADPPLLYSPALIAKPAPPVSRPGGCTNKIAALRRLGSEGRSSGFSCCEMGSGRNATRIMMRSAQPVVSAKTRISKAQDAMLCAR